MSDLQNTACGCVSCQNGRVDTIYDALTGANAPLAMAYVPYQTWETPETLCSGLQAGTVFAGLNKPFCGKGGKYW